MLTFDLSNGSNWQTLKLSEITDILVFDFVFEE